jgi:hypothetical protein
MKGWPPGKTFDQTVTLNTRRAHVPSRLIGNAARAAADPAVRRPGGDTRLAAGQPDLLFASYGDPRIAYVGHELDTLLARLIILLGGGLPLQLAAVYASGNEDA